MELVHVRVLEVQVGDRARRDLGDLSPLIKSVIDVGLLHPIVLDVERRLIAGLRRLRAWEAAHPGKEILAIIVDGLAEAAQALRAEVDENACRLDLKPSEAVELGRHLEALEAPRARARELAGKAVPKISGGSSDRHDREVAAIVGRAVGLSGRTYGKAKAVVEALGHDSSRVRDAAAEAVRDMDATGKVDGPYRRIKEATKQSDPSMAALNRDLQHTVGDRDEQRFRAKLLESVHAFRRQFLASSAERAADLLRANEWDQLLCLQQETMQWFRSAEQARRKTLRVVDGSTTRKPSRSSRKRG